MPKKIALKMKQSGISILKNRLKEMPLVKKSFDDDSDLYKVDSGSWALNLMLTNNINKAYPIGRVINAVGDFSTGKTLMACELVNAIWYIEHLQKNKKVKIYYDESEFAFDFGLARKFQMPIEQMHGIRERLPDWKKPKDEPPFTISRTVEDFYRNIKLITEEASKYDIILYIKDSLDSLQDAREIEHIKKKGIDKQDYGGGKAKVMSQMFRNCIEGINTSNILLFIVSQIRTNFGVVYGNKYNRAGGKALDHYASIIYWMKELNKIVHPQTKMIQGIEAEIHVTKNKTGERYNDLALNILHGYGVDNFGSAVNYLWDNKLLDISGNFVNWNNKKIYRTALIELAANDPATAQEIKKMWQYHWIQQIEKAKPNRPTKWGS